MLRLRRDADREDAVLGTADPEQSIEASVRSAIDGDRSLVAHRARNGSAVLGECRIEVIDRPAAVERAGMHGGEKVAARDDGERADERSIAALRAETNVRCL